LAKEIEAGSLTPLITSKINPDFFFRLLEKSKFPSLFLFEQVDKSDSGKCVPRAAREKKH
jgi:hypothetical protein